MTERDEFKEWSDSDLFGGWLERVDLPLGEGVQVSLLVTAPREPLSVELVIIAARMAAENFNRRLEESSTENRSGQ